MFLSKTSRKIGNTELTYCAVCHKNARRREYGVWVGQVSPSGSTSAFLPDIAATASEAESIAAFFAENTVTPSTAYDVYTDLWMTP